MKSTSIASIALGTLAAVLLASCGPGARNDTGTGGETGTTQDRVGAGDTMMTPIDTGRIVDTADTGRDTMRR